MPAECFGVISHDLSAMPEISEPRRMHFISGAFSALHQLEVRLGWQFLFESSYAGNFSSSIHMLSTLSLEWNNIRKQGQYK